MSEQRPAPRRFVVPTGGRRQTGTGDSKAGFTTESIGGDTEVVVAPTKSTSWSDVATAMGAAWVAPVLVDSGDAESYPTGELTVRFTKPPTDADLAAMERDDHVRLVRRNEFVDTQIVVAPIEPDGVYLPDVCERLERRDGVATVWLSTRSTYTKR